MNPSDVIAPKFTSAAQNNLLSTNNFVTEGDLNDIFFGNDYDDMQFLLDFNEEMDTENYETSLNSDLLSLSSFDNFNNLPNDLIKVEQSKSAQSQNGAEVITIPPIIPVAVRNVEIKKLKGSKYKSEARSLPHQNQRELMKDNLSQSKYAKSIKVESKHDIPIVKKINPLNTLQGHAKTNLNSNKVLELNKKRKVEIDSDDSSDSDMEGDSFKVERRERNREHAKKSRIRKKLLLETLQDQLTGLRQENVNLRRIIAEKIPPAQASKIFNECTTVESELLSESTLQLNLPKKQVTSSNIMIPQASKAETKMLMEPDFRLIQALVHSQKNFVLSDPTLPDNPIVYASEGFCKLSGYKRQDVLGRNCRFLQGPGTDPNAVDMIRKGVAAGTDVSVCLLNYKADNTPFWNQFFVAALKDSEGNIINYVGVQCEVNSFPVSAIKDRVKKLPLPKGYA